jgi:hypothetical protein
MGAAQKLAEKAKELVRVIGLYRQEKGEVVRAEIRKTEGKWNCNFPIAWTMDLHRVCDGRAQIGLLLRIFALTIGAPYPRGGEPPKWSKGYTDEDWAKQLDVARLTMRDAIEGAVERKLIERRSTNPKARGRAYYELRLLPENWPAIADPITPKKQPAVAQTVENADKRPSGTGPLHHVQPGKPVNFTQGHRYEFDVPPKVFENYLDAPGKMVLNAAGLLRIDPVKAAGQLVEMPPAKEASVENKAPKTQSRYSGLKRDGLNLADIPLTVAAMKATGFRHDANLYQKLLAKIREAVQESGAAVELITDPLIAKAIPECQFAKQTSAGAFLNTVPGWIATHLTAPAVEVQCCRNCGKQIRSGVGSCTCSMPQPSVVASVEEDPLEVYRRAKRARRQEE